MEEKKTKENDSFLSRYDTVLSFLGIELIALVFFGFGGVAGISVLKVFGAFLSVLCLPFLERAIAKEDRKKVALRLLPFGITCLLVGLSSFWLHYYSSSWLLGLFQGLLQAIGMMGFFLLGYCLKNIPSLKGEYVVFGVLCGLALIVFIGGLYGLARYGFFYAKRFSGQVYYYDGVVFPIDREAKTLLGFQMVECSLSYGKTPAFLLACSGAGLFWMNFKKQTRNCLILLGFALLGILDLVFVPFRNGLILLMGVYLLLGLVRLFLLWKGKEAKNTALVLWILVMVGVASIVLLFLLDASKDLLVSAGIPYLSRSLASSSSFFGEIRLSLQDTMYQGYFNRDSGSLSWVTLLFGYDLSSSAHLSRCFWVNLIYENGLVGFLAVMVCVFLFLRHLYLSSTQKENVSPIRGIFFALLLGAFFYVTFFADELPLCHASGFLSSTRSSLFFGLLGLAGYLYSPKEARLSEDVQHA